MKATLEFNLPEDDIEFQEAVKGSQYHNAIWEMKQWFRSQIKYSSEDVSDEKIQTIEDCQKAFFECLENNNVHDLD